MTTPVPGSLEIRRAEISDAAQIQRVHSGAGAYAGTMQLPYPSVDMWHERLTQPDPNRYLLVGLVDGVIVGCAGLHLEANMRRRHVASLGITVADDFVGQGVGTALMAELLNLADNWLHILRIELMVFTDNASGIALYRKFGFEIEGTHRADVLRDGKLVDGYSMARFHPHQPQLPATTV